MRSCWRLGLAAIESLHSHKIVQAASTPWRENQTLLQILLLLPDVQNLLYLTSPVPLCRQQHMDVAQEMHLTVHFSTWQFFTVFAHIHTFIQLLTRAILSWSSSSATTQVFFFQVITWLLNQNLKASQQIVLACRIKTKRLTSVNDHGIGWTLLKGRLTLLVPAAAANMAVQPKVTT